MFCTKCGAENPAAAEFCYKCGKPLFTPQPDPVNQPTAIAETVPAASTSNSLRHALGYEWAYGWLFVLTALYLWIVGLMTLSGRNELTPAALPFANAKSVGVGAALFQALLFGATGLAIIRRKKMAVMLVWVSIALSALGILLRGLIPLDILLWVVSLGLALWYTKKAPQLLNRAQPQPTPEPPTAHTNSSLDGQGIGLAVVLIVAILFLVWSLAKWNDRELASRPTSEATASGKHRENPKRTMTPEESKLLQESDLLSLTLDKLIARCGKPLTDTTRIFTEATIKGILRRDISYKNENGSVVTLIFWKGVEYHDWNFLAMVDGGVEYRNAEDSDHILSTLPCIGESDDSELPPLQQPH
jgi:zinc ribbon protein